MMRLYISTILALSVSQPVITNETDIYEIQSSISENKHNIDQ